MSVYGMTPNGPSDKSVHAQAQRRPRSAAGSDLNRCSG